MNTKVAKKQNNKGFTLIELIVVIAIIAVLAAILAPQYLRYVEKSRISADVSTAKEIKNAVQTACANEDVYAEINTTGTTVTWKGKGSTGTITPYGSGTKLGEELAATLKEIPGMKSKVWQNQYGTTGWTVTIKADTTNSSVTLETDPILS